MRPSLTLFFLLVGAFLLTLLPHILQLPLWITITVIGAMVIRSIFEAYRLPLPSNTFCNLLALCLLIGIIIQYKTMFGREAGTAFTVGLLAIKFYELRGPRDIALIIFSCFFVVMSALLYSQALELFIYCLIMMWVLTALLLRIQIGDLPEDQLLRMLKRSGIVFLQAFPLAIFLFFFFPRYTDKLQITLNEASLGLSDTLQPGSIAQLSKDDRPAMYVKFLRGDVPTVDTMYWRALVLWHYENSTGTWSQGKMAEIVLREKPKASSPSDEVEQEITIWPHFQKWLFALDSPVSPALNPSESPYWSTTLDGDVLQLAELHVKLDHKERYTVTSSSMLADEEATTMEKEAATQLPGSDPNDSLDDRIDPEVRKLADLLYKQNPNDEGYVSSVLSYFHREHFAYSASPGVEGKGDWLHHFLFEKKIGFCEHYASAFAILMRIEHVPARLVVGYQGAVFNPYGNFYDVKQSNAHAWDEVWIEAKHNWIRIDPTAILTNGGQGPLAGNNPGQDDANSNLSIQIAHHELTLSEAYLPSWVRRTITDMQLRREQVEANWDDWVFSYDPDTQNRLAQALGLGRNPRVQLAIACLLAVALCVAIFRILMRQRQVVSPVESLYAAFCRSMAQSGVPRAVWEGPLAYTGRVAEAFPDKKEAIEDVGRIVAHSRYGASPLEIDGAKTLQSLLTLIAEPQSASSSRERN